MARNVTKRETYLNIWHDNCYKLREDSRDRDNGSYRSRSGLDYSRRSYTSVSVAFTNIDDYMIFYDCTLIVTLRCLPLTGYGSDDGIRFKLKSATKKESHINKRR